MACSPFHQGQCSRNRGRRAQSRTFQANLKSRRLRRGVGRHAGMEAGTCRRESINVPESGSPTISKSGRFWSRDADRQ